VLVIPLVDVCFFEIGCDSPGEFADEVQKQRSMNVGWNNPKGRNGREKKMKQSFFCHKRNRFVERRVPIFR
jgi:hypothetical protein